jgi:WD40 repeat protein
MTSIFLSYARNDDEAFVRRLSTDLTSAGFDVWFDRVSMPSRQLTFHQEIRDAIVARDRLLLVVGPGVLTSAYATQEWRFAYFEAGKCVNPVVRLNDFRPDGSKVDGYELIPEDLKLLHAEDFRDDSRYEERLANLIRQLSEAIPPVGKLVAVPELPAHFNAQPERITALRDLLLVDLQKPVVVSGAAARVGLQGMGGIGKSVLASALAHRPEVRRAFPDGIFWITLGQSPNLADLQRWLARELGDEALFADERSGKECLRKLLAGRKVTLVLDDVWQREHAEAFNVIGPMGRILLTTRDAGLVTALASKETHYRVELPTESEAETIFAAAAHLELSALPSAAREIVAQCGRLPLALALCGGMVRSGVSPTDVLEALREHDLEFLSTEHPGEEQHGNVWKAMDLSLRVLPPEQRDRFAELAVFALDRGAPEAAVVTVWEHTGGLSPRHARKLLADFVARSLVQLTPASLSGKGGTRMMLHDLLHNFATGMAENRFGSSATLHQYLLDAYQKKCPLGWPSGPDDGYFFQNLIEHLLAAGRLDDAIELLTNIPWIEAKCKAKLVFSLQDDYRCTIAVIPETRGAIRQERERQARLARWTEEITAYSRQWSNRRDRSTRDGVVDEVEPRLPEPPKTCQVWTDEEIESECKRIVENPTRPDRVKAFADFVHQECYPLAEFGARSGFAVQHAFNNAPSGLVHRAAAGVLPALENCMLTRHWFNQDHYNPKPTLLRTLEGHTGLVFSVSLTRDCLSAVSASVDRTLRVWDLATGRCLRVLGWYPNAFLCLSVTPDGLRAVWGGDTTLRVWDLEAGTCLCVLEGHADLVRSVSVTPDGRCAISASNDTTLRVWDLDACRCLCVLKGHTGFVDSVSITPDGRCAVSASSDKTLRIWDLAMRSCLRVLEGHTGTVTSVSVTPDGLRAVSASDDMTLRVWNLEMGSCLRVLEGHTHMVRDVSVTPDGLRAISASWDNTMRVWDIETGRCLRILEEHASLVDSVGLTPDGMRAISGSGDAAIRSWDLEAGKCLPTLKRHTDTVNSAIVTPDGLRSVSASDDTTIRVWDLKTGKCLHVLYGHTRGVVSAAVTPDSRCVVSGSHDNTLRVWDLETGQCMQILNGHLDMVRCLNLTPDGLRAVSGSHDNTLRVWNLETGRCLRVLEGHTSFIDSICLTPDGLCAVSASGDTTLRMWDLETGRCLRVLQGHSDFVCSVSITPDSRCAISASSDKTLRMWDLETGQCLRVLEGHMGSVDSVCLTPDGRRAVSASEDSTLRVWNLVLGSCLRVLEGHTDGVQCVRLTPDGLYAVSASVDATLRVWNLETGDCLAIAHLSAPTASVAISSVRAEVVVGTYTGEVLQFDVRRIPLTAA